MYRSIPQAQSDHLQVLSVRRRWNLLGISDCVTDNYRPHFWHKIYLWSSAHKPLRRPLCCYRVPIAARYRSNWTGRRQCGRHLQRSDYYRTPPPRQRALQQLAYRALCYREIEISDLPGRRHHRENIRQCQWDARPGSPLRQIHPDRCVAPRRHWYPLLHPRRDWDTPPRSPMAVFPFPTPGYMCDDFLDPARKIQPPSRQHALQPPYRRVRFSQ